MDMKKKILQWLHTGNRSIHVAAGIAIGLGADDAYCAAYAGVSAASALELKDGLWGGKWDWTDFGCTLAGVTVGHLTRWAVWP